MTIIRKLDIEQNPISKSYKRFITPIAILLTTLIIAEIWVNNTLLSFGDKLQNMSVLENALTMENQILQNQVAKLTSLNNLASQSAKLGFSKPENIQYIR